MKEKLPITKKSEALALWSNHKYRWDEYHYDVGFQSFTFDPFANAKDWLRVMIHVAEQGDSFRRKYDHILLGLNGDDVPTHVRLAEILNWISAGTMMVLTMEAAGLAAGLWKAEET